MDNTFQLFREGYEWLPDRLRRTDGEPVPTRLMGQRAVALHGVDAARYFYDERHVRRKTALPGPVLSTIFGKGAVHTLDGAPHRRRKELFLAVASPEATRSLVDRITAAWDQAARIWPGREVVLFNEVSRILTKGAYDWSGVPLDHADVGATARDLVAMVDGFATPSLRHWRARIARRRQERRLSAFIRKLRSGHARVPPDTPADVVAWHRDADDELLTPKVAAVELLNIIRPTVAITWFVAFSAHALHTWPEYRRFLRDGGQPFAEPFAHEVRRFYPFAPFIAGRAATDLSWHGVLIPSGALVMLDVYGQNHDPELWPAPYTFRPQRFLDREIGQFDLIPQGGGDPATGHRCPGEPITVAILAALSERLAGLDYDLPQQNMDYPMSRMPTRPRSGVRLHVHAGAMKR